MKPESPSMPYVLVLLTSVGETQERGKSVFPHTPDASLIHEPEKLQI